MAEAAKRLTGRVRLNAPTLFGPRFVVPLVAEFLQRHTELKATFTLDDGFSDLAESGADVTVRIGVTPDSRLVARKLADVRRVAYASSAYLAAHGSRGNRRILPSMRAWFGPGCRIRIDGVSRRAAAMKSTWRCRGASKAIRWRR